MTIKFGVGVQPYDGAAPHPLAVERMARKLHGLSIMRRQTEVVECAMFGMPMPTTKLTLADCMWLSNWFLKQMVPEGMAVTELANLVEQTKCFIDPEDDLRSGFYKDFRFALDQLLSLIAAHRTLVHLDSLLSEKGGEG